MDIMPQCFSFLFIANCEFHFSCSRYLQILHAPFILRWAFSPQSWEALRTGRALRHIRYLVVLRIGPSVKEYQRQHISNQGQFSMTIRLFFFFLYRMSFSNTVCIQAGGMDRGVKVQHTWPLSDELRWELLWRWTRPSAQSKYWSSFPWCVNVHLDDDISFLPYPSSHYCFGSIYCNSYPSAHCAVVTTAVANPLLFGKKTVYPFRVRADSWSKSWRRRQPAHLFCSALTC